MACSPAWPSTWGMLETVGNANRWILVSVTVRTDRAGRWATEVTRSRIDGRLERRGSHGRSLRTIDECRAEPMGDGDPAKSAPLAPAAHVRHREKLTALTDSVAAREVIRRRRRGAVSSTASRRSARRRCPCSISPAAEPEWLHALVPDERGAHDRRPARTVATPAVENAPAWLLAPLPSSAVSPATSSRLLLTPALEPAIRPPPAPRALPPATDARLPT